MLHVPASVIKAKSAPYLSGGKPARRNPMVNESDYNIVGRFGAEYRGLVQYYLLAGDVFRLHRLRWVMETSMLKTLASKHRSSVSKMAARYKAKIDTSHGPRTCFEASVASRRQATTGGQVRRYSLKRQKKAIITDRLMTGPIYPNQGADQTAPGGQMRALRANGQHRGAPRPQTRRSQPARPATTPLGTGHGQDAAASPSWSAATAMT